MYSMYIVPMERRIAETVSNDRLDTMANAAASLDPDYQKQAYEIFMKNKILTLPDLQLLKEQQEAEKGIPGQMTIEQATGQLRPPENDKPVGVGLQVERFFESLNKGEKQRILNRDVGMAAYLISMRHREARIRNGYFNFQADKEGITFNPGSDQECTDSWSLSDHRKEKGETRCRRKK